MKRLGLWSLILLVIGFLYPFSIQAEQAKNETVFVPPNLGKPANPSGGGTRTMEIDEAPEEASKVVNQPSSSLPNKPISTTPESTHNPQKTQKSYDDDE